MGGSTSNRQMTDATRPVDVTRVRGGVVSSVTDQVVVELPIEFRLGKVPIAVLMRTPGDDEALALGFALTEAIAIHPHEVEAIVPVPGDDQGDRYEIRFAQGISVDPEQFRRNLFASSSCGVCGKASIDAVRLTAAPVSQAPELDHELIMSLPGKMRPAQRAFATTGGLHAASLFELDGTRVVTCEDVGRHNAVDKAIGSLARERWPLADLILMVSGRVSFEIAQKAAVAGIPVVCGVSAPSSLAIELAAELGMTVIGFLRDEGYNRYS